MATRTSANATAVVAAAVAFIADSFSMICVACHISTGHIVVRKHTAYDAHFVNIIIIIIKMILNEKMTEKWNEPK